MVGDGLYTDIVGGLAAGLGTVLVTDHGLLKGFRLEGEGRAGRHHSRTMWFRRLEEQEAVHPSGGSRGT